MPQRRIALRTTPCGPPRSGLRRPQPQLAPAAATRTRSSTALGPAARRRLLRAPHERSRALPSLGAALENKARDTHLLDLPADARRLALRAAAAGLRRVVFVARARHRRLNGVALAHCAISAEEE